MIIIYQQLNQFVLNTQFEIEHTIRFIKTIYDYDVTCVKLVISYI